MKKVYLDNAATSNPKPPSVVSEVKNYLENICSSPGRGGYFLGLEAGRIIFDTRQKLRRLFNAPSEEYVIFTLNVTYALNFALLGVLKSGDHVITTSMEHNSVIRPLRYLERTRRIVLDIIKCNKKGELDPGDIKKAIKPTTKMIVMTHASNVTGGIMPIEILQDLKEYTDAMLVVDAAQTAGVLEIDFQKLGLDFLCFTGHKALYGPPGTGGMVISPRAAKILAPSVHGGTGSRSNVELQPDFMPDKMEAGTPNTAGIAGLNAGLDFILEKGVENIHQYEMQLTRTFANELQQIPGIRVWGTNDMEKMVSTVSITVEGRDLSELAFSLDADYGIMIRSGLHCSPLGHKTIGTFPEGTLRFSFGYFNTEEEVIYSIETIRKLAARLGP